MRGADLHRNFTHEPEPRGDLDPVAVEFHRRALEARGAVIYKGIGGPGS